MGICWSFWKAEKEELVRKQREEERLEVEKKTCPNCKKIHSANSLGNHVPGWYNLECHRKVKGELYWDEVNTYPPKYWQKWEEYVPIFEEKEEIIQTPKISYQDVRTPCSSCTNGKIICKFCDYRGGYLYQSRACYNCHLSGYITCERCHGTGSLTSQKPVTTMVNEKKISQGKQTGTRTVTRGRWVQPPKTTERVQKRHDDKLEYYYILVECERCKCWFCDKKS